MTCRSCDGLQKAGVQPAATARTFSAVFLVSGSLLSAAARLNAPTVPYPTPMYLHEFGSRVNYMHGKTKG